jgi:hypothetical protein
MSRVGREGEFDAVRGLLGEPGFGLLGDVHTRPRSLRLEQPDFTFGIPRRS